MPDMKIQYIIPEDKAERFKAGFLEIYPLPSGMTFEQWVAKRCKKWAISRCRKGEEKVAVEKVTDF